MGQMESGLDAYMLDLGSGYGPGTPLYWSGFPYTVPEGHIYRVRAQDFTCKFPYDFDTRRTCYFQMYFASTVSAHHPRRDFAAPFDLPAGYVINGMVMNGMRETQNMEFFLHGELLEATNEMLMAAQAHVDSLPRGMQLDPGGEPRVGLLKRILRELGK